MSTARRIASSTIWQFASQIVMAALSIVAVKLVAIGLSKELAGTYNSAYGFLQLFGILADFGLYAVAVRDVARAQHRGEAIGAFLVVRCCTLFISLASALLIVWSVPAWQHTPLPLAVTIAALSPLFTLLAGVFRVVFQVHFRMGPVFVAEVAQRAASTLIIAILVLSGMRGSTSLHDVHLLLFAGGVGAFVLFIISGTLANRLERVRPVFHTAHLITLLKSAAPFGIAYLCMAAYRQFDLTMIALLRDDFDIQNAYYGFVLRITDMGFLLPTFLLNSVLPMLQSHERSREHVGRILGGTLLTLLCIGSVGALGSGLWARPIVALLTTPQYLSTATQFGSDSILRVLSVPIFFNGIILYAFYTLLHTGRWKPLVGMLLAGAAASITLNLILIPRMGFMGATLTSAVVHAGLALALLPVSLRVHPVQLAGTAILRWIVFSALLAGGLLLLKPMLTSDLATAVGLIVAGGVIVAAGWASGLPGVIKKMRVAA